MFHGPSINMEVESDSSVGSVCHTKIHLHLWQLLFAASSMLPHCQHLPGIPNDNKLVPCSPCACINSVLIINCWWRAPALGAGFPPHQRGQCENTGGGFRLLARVWVEHVEEESLLSGWLLQHTQHSECRVITLLDYCLWSIKIVSTLTPVEAELIFRVPLDCSASAVL